MCDKPTSEYLFISYSHVDKATVDGDVAALRERGARLWIDDEMKIGDDWWIRAENAMRDDRCVGVVYYNSPNAFISSAVNKERKLGKELKEIGKLKVFGVNLGALTSDDICDKAMELADTPQLKRGYRESVATFDMFSSEKLVVRETDTARRIDSIYGIAEECGCVDSAEAVKKTLAVSSSSENAVLCFGAYKGEPVDYPSVGQKYGRISTPGGELIISGGAAFALKPLKWSVLYAKDGVDVFLCDSCINYAPNDAALTEFLRGEFYETAFTAQERAAFCAPPRLLNEGDIKIISERNGKNRRDVLDNENGIFVRHWWTAIRGIAVNFAKTVYRGTINTIGFNVREKKGVKPVIELKHDAVANFKGDSK